jgi:hypothetical protein
MHNGDREFYEEQILFHEAKFDETEFIQMVDGIKEELFENFIKDEIEFIEDTFDEPDEKKDEIEKLNEITIENHSFELEEIAEKLKTKGFFAVETAARIII